PGASDHYFAFGPGNNAGWIPLVGDWNGDGTDTIGLYQPDISLFHLKDSFTPGASDHYFAFGPGGNAGWIPMVGDWNGDGIDTIGLYEPEFSRFHLKDSFTPGASDYYFAYGPGGNAGWTPLSGDWDGPSDAPVSNNDPPAQGQRVAVQSAPKFEADLWVPKTNTINIDGADSNELIDEADSMIVDDENQDASAIDDVRALTVDDASLRLFDQVWQTWE
ncbi:MAG: hypothetical protein KDB00_02300, partial [Planctomycetales bacterium]|nr:hypothetical protein [Planctomycetales bacterium]